MANDYDSWLGSKRAPEPVVVAKKQAGDVALDVLTAREEFVEAGRMISKGASVGDRSQRSLSTFLSGLGAGVFTAGTFVVPWGRAGSLARGARGVPALRAAAGLGDEAFGAATGRSVSDALEQDLRSAGLKTPSKRELVESFEPLGRMGREGGFTWDPRTGQNQFSSGYSVAVIKGYELPIPADQFDSLKVLDYLRFVPEGETLSVAQRLAANPRNVVGAWLEPINGVDHVFMDVASVLPDRNAALRIGGAQGELGVFDFSSMNTIRLADNPDFLPGGKKYDPNALARYGFADDVVEGIPAGDWVDNPTAELVPTRWLDQFKEHARSGKQVDDLIPQIRERGFDDPLVLEVGMNGRAMVTEGNHRLAAAQKMGLDSVPVRAITARSVKGGAEVAVRDVSAGKFLKPSDVIRPDDGGNLAIVSSGPSPDVPPSLLAGEGGFAGDIPGKRVRELAEQMAQRHLDSPQGLAAVPPEEIASVLAGLPEFEQFVRMYREMVVQGMKGLDRRKLRSGAQNEFARFARLTSPDWAKGSDTSISFAASLSMVDSLPESVRKGAVNLGIRIRNMDVFVNDDIHDPTFYREFNRILNVVSEETGMPLEVLSMALASASSQAAPYDEVLRFVRVSRMVNFDNGRASIVPGSLELLRDDSMAITALRGLVDTINNPDFLTGRPAGQAMKTSAYAYNRYHPLYVPVYVADTVDGLGQFLIAGTSPGTSDARFSIVNQIAGRTLSSVYKVPPSAMQEATWSHIRVARDGMKLTPKGKPTQEPISSAFTGSQGSIEDILIGGIRNMDPRVVRLARENLEKFYQQVREGRVDAWDWDNVAKRPSISSAEYLIPADQRAVKGGRAGLLQAQMLEMVNALGPTLRQRLLALTAVTGIGLDVWVRALGDAASVIPTAAWVGAGAGAVLGGTASSAEASDGSVSLAAAPIAGGMAFGAAAGAISGAGVAGLAAALSGKSKAIAAAFKSPGFSRVANSSGVQEAIASGAVSTGYQPGVIKDYGRTLSGELDLNQWSASGSTLGEDLGALSFNDGMTHGDSRVIDKIVRDEVEGLISVTYNANNPATVGTDAELETLAANLGSQIYARAKTESRWGTDLPNSLDIFDSSVPHGRLDVGMTRAAVRLKVQTFHERSAELARYKIYERILTEMPHLKERVAFNISSMTGQSFSRLPVFQDFMQNAVPVIAFDRHDMERILSSGYFLNQYVAKTASGEVATNGTRWPGLRASREFVIGDIDIAAGASERPVYGYFAYPETKRRGLQDAVERSVRKSRTSPFGEEQFPMELSQFMREQLRISSDDVRQYGDVNAVLKPEVKKNLSTFTVNDSLGGSNFLAPANGFDAEDAYFANFEKFTKYNYSSLMQIRYIEGQFNIMNRPIDEIVDYFVVKSGDGLAYQRLQRIYPDIPVKFLEW